LRLILAAQTIVPITKPIAIETALIAAVSPAASTRT
jgi:hypothetical protein